MARYYNKNSKNLFPCGFSLIVNSHKTFTAQEIHHLFNEFQLSTFRTNVCIHENPYQCLFVCEACLGTSEWQNKESIRTIIDDQMGKHIFSQGKESLQEWSGKMNYQWMRGMSDWIQSELASALSSGYLLLVSFKVRVTYLRWKRFEWTQWTNPFVVTHQKDLDPIL